MARVFLWMVVGMAVGYFTMLGVVEMWGGPAHAPINRSQEVWLLLSMPAVGIGAILGALFGVADAVTRSVRSLVEELKRKYDGGQGANAGGTEEK